MAKTVLFGGVKTAQGNQDGNSKGDFYYAPPSGHLALCTNNLADPTVESLIQGNKHFKPFEFTGNGASTRAITGVGFAPGMVWLKNQTDTSNGFALDRVRGNTYSFNMKAAFASSQDAESNHATQLKSLDSDGFTVGSGDINANNDAISAFAFKTPMASPVSNTDGSITSSVSANVDAGFSWVGWTGTESSATIGHGLSQAPEWVIVKDRNESRDYPVNIANVYGMSANSYMIRNSTAAVATSAAYWGAAPNATTFTVGNSANTNDGQSDDSMVFS